MLNKLFSIMVVGLLFVGCADDELAPVITFSELEVGAFPRLVEFTRGEYDLQNLGSSSIAYTVEFVDDNQGQNVASYAVFGTFSDANPSNGDQSKAEILLQEFAASSFATNANGLPELTYTLSATEVFSKFGIDGAAILPGDRVRFRTVVTKTDGTPFGSSNSTSAVTNAFGGIFDFSAVFTCPLDNSAFAGTYNYEIIDGDDSSPFGTLFGGPAAFELVPVAGSTTKRQFDFQYLSGFLFDVTGELDFVCDVIQPRAIDSGVGCGGGTIVVGSGGDTPFNINDDSTFDIKYTNFAADGGCGVASSTVTIRFTKA